MYIHVILTFPPILQQIFDIDMNNLESAVMTRTEH